MEQDSHYKQVFDSVENLIYMDANKIRNFLKSLNKDNVAEEISKQKVIKTKSEPRQNSFRMLRMSIICFKLIGLATFAQHVVTRKKITSYTFQYSEFGIVYNVVLSSLVIASNYLSIPNSMSMEYENRTNLTVSIEILQSVLGTLMVCAVLLSYCMNQKSLVRIANRLMDIEHEIDRLYHLYRPLRRQRIFCAQVIVCVFNVCLLILLATSDFLAFQSGPTDWLTDILPTFHVGWLLIQYLLLVTVIQADFAYVNQAIQSLTRVSTHESRSQSLYQTRRVVVSNSTVHQLLQLRDMHCHLCEISEDVSDFYALPVLCGLAFLFLTLIYNGYYLLSPLLISDDILQYRVLSNTVIWLIFLTYHVSLLANRITKTLNEVG